MGDFNKCIDASVANGKISKKLAEELKQSDDIEATLNQKVQELSVAKRETAIQTVVMAKNWENIKSHGKSGYKGLQALLARDLSAKADYISVDSLAKTTRGKYHSMVADLMSKFRTKRIGFSQDQEGLDKLVRSLFGEAVDDVDIKTFGKSFNELTEKIRGDFNARGGNISKLESWVLPQTHNKNRITKAGKDKWKSDIVAKLDREKMRDDLGNKLTDKELDESLDYVYETITTNGLNKTKDFTPGNMGRKLSRKGSEKRFLHFKNADGWLDYQKEYGKGDVFTNMTDYIDNSAHDVALMEIMGPNPEEMYRSLKNQVAKESGLTQNQSAMSDSRFNVVSGKLNDGELTTFADIAQGTRNLLTAGLLGKAFLSALSDVAFIGITANLRNVPVMKTFSRQLALMNPANEADRKFAVKLGLLADNWTTMATSANRMGDSYGVGWTAKISEGVMRAGLLSPWTDAGRKAFGMEFSSMLADNFKVKFDDLDASIKGAFKEYGIEKSDWDTFRKSPTLKNKGVGFADMTQPGGEKFHNMVLTETDFAVPTPDANVQAITTAGMARNTVGGQLWRSAMMFKSFPFTIIMSHGYRMAQQNTTAGKLAYGASLFGITTALGALVIQAKDLVSGKEPRPADNKEFWGAALAQGGGLGIFGDFIAGDANRFGGGIGETFLGPTAQLVSKVGKLTLGNVQDLVKGEETHLIKDAVDIGKFLTPDVWQVEVFSNAVWDQAKLMADPKAQKQFNRTIKKRRKDFDQGYWWRPGDPLPELN